MVPARVRRPGRGAADRVAAGCSSRCLLIRTRGALTTVSRDRPQGRGRRPAAPWPHHGERHDQRRRHRRPGRTRRRASSGPPTAPASAAPRPISRSVPPCAVGRSSAATDSVTSVEPAIRPQDQPRPSSSSPAPSWTRGSGRRGAGERRRRRAAAPRRRPTVVRRPARSASQPTSGENRYMPATCTLMTRPMIRSVVPSAAAGVAHVHRGHDHDADHHRVRRPRPRSGRAGRRRGPDRAQRPPAWPAARRRAGPDRRRSRPGEQQRVGPQQQRGRRAPTSANTTADTAKAPPSGGQPERRAEVVARAGEVGPEHRADRRGPDHQDRPRPRRSGAARSAAA